MKSIIVGTDFSKGSYVALELAVDIANKLECGVKIIWAKREKLLMDEEQLTIMTHLAEEKLEMLCEQHRSKILNGDIRWEICSGKVGAVISRQAQHENSPLIVIGTNGLGSGSSVGTGFLTWPTGPGGGISRGWSGTHGGIDIWNSANTPIYAADSGVVIVSQDTTVGYGRYVIIDHQNGMQTLYGHMNTRLVEVGEVVAKGQLIGLMGMTGLATGNHLHFEVRLGGGYSSRTDPAPFLFG